MVQDVGQEQVDASIQCMHPDGFLYCFGHKNMISAGYQQSTLFALLKAPWLLQYLLNINNKDN